MINNVVTARMLETATALTPEDVAAYLASVGWKDVGAYGPLAKLYCLQTAEQKYEVVVPESDEVSDFKWRVIEMILVLSTINKESTEETCEKIDNYFENDLIRMIVEKINARFEREEKRDFRGMWPSKVSRTGEKIVTQKFGYENLMDNSKSGKNVTKKKRA